MKKLIVMLMFIPLVALAQKKGVRFQRSTTWEKVKTMAKAKNKYIFVNCFTTWCCLCKYMTSNIFPQENVGTFFNANFINLKVQMDQTKMDSEDVKAWYAEAERFMKDYQIDIFPTFLIFNPDGELVYRIVGGDKSGDKFIEKVKLGLNPATQQKVVLKKLEKSPNDTQLIRQVCEF